MAAGKVNAADNAHWIQQAHMSQLQSVAPAVKALMEYYETNQVNCSIDNEFMVPMDNQPYFETLYSDEQCVLTLGASANAAFSTSVKPTIYRFWPVCEMVGDELQIVSWRAVTNADINMAYFSNSLRDTGYRKVMSRLPDPHAYPFNHIEFHSDPMSNIALPHNYVNNCLRETDYDA